MRVLVKSTSALVMLSNGVKMMTDSKRRFVHFLVYATVGIFVHTMIIYGGVVKAELLERVVAVVNDNVILLSEFERELKISRKEDGDITEEEILNNMIDRIIVLEQIRKFKIGETSGVLNIADERELVNEYIDRRVKSLIYIPFEDIEAYYVRNKERYYARELHEVRAEIESHLKQERLAEALDEHMAALRKSTYIRIQLEE